MAPFLTPREKEKLQRDLSKCKTAGEILNHLQEIFDLDKNELGLITKPAFISGAIKAVEMVKPPKKRAI